MSILNSKRRRRHIFQSATALIATAVSPLAAGDTLPPLQDGQAPQTFEALTGKQTKQGQSVRVGAPWQGAAPEFRKLRWLEDAGLLHREGASAKDVEPTWESMAANYRPPDWFQDGKLGVWMHWGIPSAIDEDRPNDGSHYGRRMYGPNEGETGAQLQMTKTLSEWHARRYGPPAEFGYEKLVPLFNGEKWDPDALVKFFKQCGARFIMPVAVHHDNFDMYDSSFPWNSVKMGPRRDTLREWKDAATRYGLLSIPKQLHI